VQRFFESYRNASSTFDLELTHAPLEGVDIAAAAGGMDTVVALGGDGLIHEVVNGLMAIDQRDRPRLGIIPMGSGNDFARTLGATFNDPDAAIAQILGGEELPLDLGWVSADGGDPTYFVETLSFGLDAAIALDTTDRRAQGTSQEGAGLFATSGIRLLAEARRGWSYQATFDGTPASGSTVIFAVQNGPTYGGGFRITPQADPTDGMLDVCLCTKVPGLPRALTLFGLARTGRHTRSSIIQIRRARSLSVSFDEKSVPCQVDGDRLDGSSFEVEAVPAALRVIVPEGTRLRA
jgi:YegS/Rv2252/BmrU family lipid kinase